MASTDNDTDLTPLPLPPCKLEYLSDSDGGDDFDELDSDSDDEPDFLWRDSDDDDDSDSDSSASSTSRNKEDTDTWKECGDKKGLSTQKNISFNPSRKGVNTDIVPLNSTPLQCVHALITETIIEEMVVLVNERGQKKNSERNGQVEENAEGEAEFDSDIEEPGGTGPWEDMTLGEMYKYLLVLVSMSVHARPGMNLDYIWGKNYVFGGEWFNKMIPKQRFFQVAKLVLEVFDFSDLNPKSTVRGMVKWIMKNSQAAFYPEKHLLVEEMVVGTPKTGWSHISCDIGTPENHRVKTLGLIDNESSYIVDLFLCYGPSKKCYNPSKLNNDFTVKILDQLLSSCCSGHHLYLSKDYSSLPILSHLEQKFYYIGHVDERKHNCIPREVKNKEKLQVGEMKWYMDEDDKNLMAKYRDCKYKRTSALISNHAEVKTEYSQEMTMPAMFHDYNLTIKGRERVHDSMGQYGHFERPEKQWEKKFFQWLFEIIQLNAFVLYKQTRPEDVKTPSLYKFKRILASELCCLAGKLYNNVSEKKRIDGCLCYRFEVPEMPKRKEEEREDDF